MTYQTINYGLFGFDTNRPLDTKRADELAQNIAEKDLGELYPIVVREEKGKLLVVDGQHRFYVRSTLGLSIFYTIADESITLADIRRAEAKHKDWNGNDYVSYYASLGNEHYKRLVQLMAETGWAASNMLIMRTSMTELKSGELKLDNDDVIRIKTSINIFEKLTKVLPFKVDRRIFYSACWKIATKDFNLDELAERVKTYRAKVFPCQRSSQYQQMFQDVYNFKRRTGKAYLTDM